MEKSLSGKNILITGGTSALGSFFVRKALQCQANVFFTYYSDQILAKELARHGAKGFQLDLSKAADILTFSTNLRDQIEHLDILIHNAAAVRDKTIHNLSEEDWDFVLNVNLRAPYLLTKELLPILFLKKAKLKEAPHAIASKIFFITSRVAFQGGFGVSNYASAKAALIGLTKSLAQELGKRNVLVNAVNPGFMRSKMTKDLPEPVIQANLDMSPLSRFSEPEEVAEFLIYLCSNQMTQVTGQVFSFESRKT